MGDEYHAVHILEETDPVVDRIVEFELLYDMSTVGPRPALPAEVATYDDYQRQRLLVKPGLTCYWQTRRNRDSITFDEWVDLDLWWRPAKAATEAKYRAQGQ